MASNVTLYKVNTTTIANMLEGSTRTLPKNWLSHTFRVRREAVHEALQWLKENNPLYQDITISEQHLKTLPDDEIPVEIEALIQCEDDAAITLQERDGYVQDAIQDEIHKFVIELVNDDDDPDEVVEDTDGDLQCSDRDNLTNDEEPDVIPLHTLSVTDSDLSRVSSSELMSHALTNLMDVTQEGGYVVQHSLKPIGDFGKDAMGRGMPNPLAAAFPLNASLREHARWAMQYYDCWFVLHHAFPFVMFAMIQKWDAMRSACLQMQRKDFECDTLALSCLTVIELRKAKEEEARKTQISNPWYHGMIWGSCLFLGGPTIWMMINPADIHDPIAQVLARETIDLDNFDTLEGPDSHQRANNIASNPYAATKFFNFLIETMLETLLGITKWVSRCCSDMGILGRLTGYFGVVEAQGGGTLHVHMLLWLAGTPNTAKMPQLLQTPAFHEKIQDYIHINIHAHLDDITEQDLKMMPRNSQKAICSSDNCSNLNSFTCALEQPVFVFKTTSFYGELEAEENFWINTNGEDTKDITFYVTAYATKKQKKSHNLSALMASTLAYHENNPWYEDIRKCNRLLLYHCINVINREAELSGLQVVSYIMGYGDTFKSHSYAPLYTSALFTAIRQMFPGLSTTATVRSVRSDLKPWGSLFIWIQTEAQWGA
ncbi:hypothetical protein M404DRAFT_29447 [Pisolithus tinctorius Marx 270]|uniref:Uncharacterized protein n=1 Tax=Pisolithus tinctorius Marx 270 TaxID=870435 RepID=A0A0C3NZH8_PISTI|nr:hypothetical protein M404DRAFT_29447 [Pisolithus tinctorius Marx 270]